MVKDSISKILFDYYDRYREKSISRRRFSHDELITVLKKIAANSSIHMENVGKSIEERDLYLIKIGGGKTKVFAWSQMHGDESTATMAILDILNFFTQDDELNYLRQSILNNVTLYFLPMVNPDGAERFTRRNALNIDLNRDALELQFPESQILNRIRDEIQPKFGFNLHDQSKEYSAGVNKKPAVLSFLAPPYNYEREVNSVRIKAMKLVAHISREISSYIPDSIGRYSDEFEPRAFGDNFVKRGTSTILIESGWYPGDAEKQFIRKLNFCALLAAFFSIGNSSYEEYSINDYLAIPENQKLMFDLLLKNATIKHGSKDYIIDLGINLEEIPYENNQLMYKSNVADIGDLSTFSGYQEFDSTGLILSPGKIHSGVIKSLEDLKKVNFFELFQKGYIYFIADNVLKMPKYFNFPTILLPNSYLKPPETAIDSVANFVFLRGEDVAFVVINGSLVDVSKKVKKTINGLIVR